MVLPSPSWPLSFVPQHCTDPSESTAQVKLLPAASAVTPPLPTKVMGPATPTMALVSW